MGGNPTCKKLTLNKENIKSFMFALRKAFFRNKAESIAMKSVDNTNVKGFPHFLPSTKALYSLFLNFFFFFLAEVPEESNAC